MAGRSPYEHGARCAAKKPFYKKVWFWVVIAALLLAGAGMSQQDDAREPEPAVEAAQEPQPMEGPTPTEGAIPLKAVDGFVRAYNEVSASPIEGAAQVGTLAYEGQSYGYTLSMAELPTQAMVEIQSNGDYAGMRAPFADAVAALDPSVAGEAGDAFDSALQSLDPTGEDVVFELGSLRIDFSPQNELETGHIQIWFDR